ALRGNPAIRAELPTATEDLLHRFAGEHDTLRDAVSLLRTAADRLADHADETALAAVDEAHRFLVEELLPHERAEEAQLYPALATPLGSGEATATMSRTHAEIQRLSSRIGTHLELAHTIGRIGADQVDDLLACLYGLYALLRLHFLQEEENYFTLAEDTETASAPRRSGSRQPQHH
ncbi:hemerythrin domain-containing protein, partial [Nocardia gipuzkoensis]